MEGVSTSAQTCICQTRLALGTEESGCEIESLERLANEAAPFNISAGPGNQQKPRTKNRVRRKPTQESAADCKTNFGQGWHRSSCKLSQWAVGFNEAAGAGTKWQPIRSREHF
ncbi:hypothetical protein OSTOST_23825 [Ostertagia ostertagi]